MARQKGLWTRMFHRPQSNKRLVCDFSQVPYFFELRFYLTWKTRCAVYLFLRRFNQRIEVEMLCNFYSFLKAPRHWGYSFLFNSHNHHRKFTISILQLETPRDSEFPRDSVLKDQAARIALLLSLGALETLSYLVWRPALLLDISPVLSDWTTNSWEMWRSYSSHSPVWGTRMETNCRWCCPDLSSAAWAL